jgi:hypothetical protein
MSFFANHTAYHLALRDGPNFGYPIATFTGRGTSMTELHTFFQGADNYLGVFYPNGYLIAMFPDLTAAQEVARDLQFSGLFQPDEVLAVAGIEVVRHDLEHTKTPWGALLTGLSRMIGTEAYWADRDLDMARSGSALLAVHCPLEDARNAAWERIQRHRPLAARYYSVGLGGIEHLAGDPQEG